MAGGPGFEPGLTGSEPVVLPLNYPPAGRRFRSVKHHFRAGDALLALSYWACNPIQQKNFVWSAYLSCPQATRSPE